MDRQRTWGLFQQEATVTEEVYCDASCNGSISGLGFVRISDGVPISWHCRRAEIDNIQHAENAAVEFAQRHY